MADRDKDSGKLRRNTPRAGFDETMEYLTPADLIPDPVLERQIAQMRRARLRKQGFTDRQIDAVYGPDEKRD